MPTSHLQAACAQVVPSGIPSNDHNPDCDALHVHGVGHLVVLPSRRRGVSEPGERLRLVTSPKAASIKLPRKFLNTICSHSLAAHRSFSSMTLLALQGMHLLLLAPASFVSVRDVPGSFCQACARSVPLAIPLPPLPCGKRQSLDS